MSREYVLKTGAAEKVKTSSAMRTFCQRPGRHDKDGNPIYKTEQSHKKECDINNIIRKYDKQGIITHVSKFEAQFGDMTGLEFQTMQNKVLSAKEQFGKLPSKIRKRFGNNPKELLAFMEDSNNREEAIKLGLINERWTPQTDGLGEHVPEDGNVVTNDSD